MKKLLFILFLSTLTFAQVKIKPRILPKSDKVKGNIIRIDSFPTKLIKPRAVDIWIPIGYSNKKKYNVIYMHDGQNLFDSNTTWNKQEWMADETAIKLMDQEEVENFIIVGIHNIPDLRFFDLYPKKTINYLPKKVKDSLFEDSKKKKLNITDNSFKGDDYLKFIVTELKPYIDANFFTLKEAENTFVGGSSMGGLMSMYAICEYPSIFSGAICISTHWPGLYPEEKNPIPSSFFNYLKANIPSSTNHKFYFDFGTETLDQHYPQYEETVNQLFLEKGYNNTHFKNLRFEGENHSEASWQKRFDIPLLFMLGK
ncbi:putative esterase [Flavobacterium sp. 9AF]|uniref:alpha/beta hydrolase n=1 Tax=Flavobacterium sp. 9AF TaxID=2653142 RepID=UPI0012F3BEF9|nr:alpha/beta hydrolase-fold protein [Flavobacterium sp. 9AF]VXC26749.1 putative esterase [Flavobacterium sp. 9AF]